MIRLGAIAIWLAAACSSASAPPPAPKEQGSAEPPARPIPGGARAGMVPAPSLARKPVADPTGLAEDLRAGDPKVRRAAAHELARASDPDPEMVLAASKDPDLEVAVVATRALGNLYAQGQVPLKELVTRATDRNGSERIRQTALNGIGQIANEDAARLFAGLLATGDVSERRTAAALLANQDMAIAIPALITALGDADEFVRANALDSLRARSRGRDFGTDASAWQAWWQSRGR